MGKKLKILLIPASIILIVALVMLGINLNNKNKEKKHVEGALEYRR